ncbi:hypothetical protein TRFO_39231 [Tritrichomonas foetus]|uniref:Uncharacterized protein n=1 Tax=Tritrichomonas foetus TaxID=1144522 RepID=A0A1J4J5Q5_9EUKA|nr:hypothetical protein TRFO_39231 [Tritrichomonas foetus]|eukprot:OHS94576.1 hypothetical protein TRFO_39231 [Tritrichomonas foetus]
MSFFSTLFNWIKGIFGNENKKVEGEMAHHISERDQLFVDSTITQQSSINRKTSLYRRPYAMRHIGKDAMKTNFNLSNGFDSSNNFHSSHDFNCPNSVNIRSNLQNTNVFNGNKSRSILEQKSDLGVYRKWCEARKKRQEEELLSKNRLSSQYSENKQSPIQNKPGIQLHLFKNQITQLSNQQQPDSQRIDSNQYNFQSNFNQQQQYQCSFHESSTNKIITDQNKSYPYPIHMNKQESKLNDKKTYNFTFNSSYPTIESQGKSNFHQVNDNKQIEYVQKTVQVSKPTQQSTYKPVEKSQSKQIDNSKYKPADTRLKLEISSIHNKPIERSDYETVQMSSSERSDKSIHFINHKTNSSKDNKYSNSNLVSTSDYDESNINRYYNNNSSRISQIIQQKGPPVPINNIDSKPKKFLRTNESIKAYDFSGNVIYVSFDPNRQEMIIENQDNTQRSITFNEIKYFKFYPILTLFDSKFSNLIILLKKENEIIDILCIQNRYQNVISQVIGIGGGFQSPKTVRNSRIIKTVKDEVPALYFKEEPTTNLTLNFDSSVGGKSRIDKYYNIRERRFKELINKKGCPIPLFVFENTQQNQLPESAMPAYDEDGKDIRVYFETEAIFIQYEDSSYTRRIFYDTIQSFKFFQIKEKFQDKFTILLIECNTGEIVNIIGLQHRFSNVISKVLQT